MTFVESIQTCFKKYADFTGCASRSEFWWFFLFLVVASIVLSQISTVLSGVFSLATLVPSLAAGARRLHDTDRTGWLQLLMFIPFIGWIILVVFEAQESKPNRYGTTSGPVVFTK